MEITMGLGTLLGVAVLVMWRWGKIGVLTLLIPFLAGVLLAGSAVGLVAKRVTEGGAQMVQSGLNGASNGNGAPAKTPVKPRTAKARTTP